MKNKFFLFALVLATLSLSTMTSCKKDEINSCQTQETVIGEESNCVPDDSSKGSVKPFGGNSAQFVPNCVREFTKEYEDLYDFSQLLHINELDTAGYYTYAAPSKYFPSVFLVICADRNEIVLSFSFDLGENFDIDYYLQGNPLEIYAMTPDWNDLMFWCEIDFGHNELNVLYVNEYLMNTRSKFINPSRICQLVVGAHALITGSSTFFLEGSLVAAGLAAGTAAALCIGFGFAVGVGALVVTTFCC